jgi:hypothetical protein
MWGSSDDSTGSGGWPQRVCKESATLAGAVLVWIIRGSNVSEQALGMAIQGRGGIGPSAWAAAACDRV